MFGISVTISEDTLVVGATWWNVPGVGRPGGALIFEHTGTTWTERAVLTADDGEDNDHFGLSIGLDGDTILISSPWEDVGGFKDAGSGYIFTGADDQWQQQAHLFGSEIEAGSHFGAAVDIDGDTAIIGVPGAKVGANADQGAAYIFTRQAGIWQPQQKLTAADGKALDSFGAAVVLDGDALLVGAQDAVYVFVRAETTWTEQARLASPDPDGKFGGSLALDGDTAVIGAHLYGAQGAAFVFVRSGTAWTQQAQLAASDGAAGDHFGRSVALSGDTVAIGAPHDDVDDLPNAGLAYVFTRSDGLWSEQAHLSASDGAVDDAFGAALALDGDALLAGAPMAVVNGGSGQGAVYAFTHGEGGWVQQAKLLASDGAAGDHFGGSLALDSGRALIGSRSENGDAPGADAGYVFAHLGSVWPQIGKLSASESAGAEAYGLSVALDGLTALAGAPDTGSEGMEEQGVAFFHELTVDFPVMLPLLLHSD